ncbi:MAG: hypothetical protein MR437_04170 [Clostridiales bacterium]|nr:hypothetical protein [Clostridiales bacterium]
MKKLGKLMAVLAIACLASTSFFTANAQISTVDVAESIITSSGSFNSGDWKKVGENTEKVYTTNVQGDVATVTNAPDSYLFFGNPFKFSDGDVSVSFDLVKVSADAMFTTWAAPTISMISGTYWFYGTGHGAYANFVDNWHNSKTYNEDSEYQICKDKALTEAYDIANGYDLMSSGEYGAHIEMIYAADRSFGVRKSLYLADGSLGNADEIWFQNTFRPSQFNTETPYYAVLQFKGEELTIDNMKIEQGNKLIQSEDCSGEGWLVATTGVLTPDTMCYYAGNTAWRQESIANLAINNPSNDNRIVTELKINANKDLDDAFVVTGSIQFEKLTKKFGFAFGLETQGQTVADEKTSYLYFRNTDGVTYVNVAEGGVDGTPESLGFDVTSLGAVDFTLACKTDGTVNLTVKGKTVELKVKNYSGYFAVVTDGEGEAIVKLGVNTKVTKYVFRGREDGAGVSDANFNNGYVNPDEFFVNSFPATTFKNPDEARGIVAEDGKLKFAGTAVTSAIGTTKKYADCIVEFKYEIYHDDDKPEVNAEYHSELNVNFGISEGNSAGWAGSVMIGLLPDGKESPTPDSPYVFARDFVNGNGGNDYSSLIGDYKMSPTEKGKTRTHAVKIVVMNGTISVYMQDVTSETFAKERYVKIGEFKAAKYYGYIALATGSNGWFNIDDLKITPIDDPKLSVMEKNLAEYVDFSAIEDDLREVKLGTPVIKANGNVVTWNAVEKAEGYIVNVDGVEHMLGKDQLSFTVEDGEHTVFVIAKGNGKEIKDSEASLSVKAGKASEPASGSDDSQKESGNSGNAESSGGGCFSAVGSATALFGAVVAAAVVIKRKRNER